MTPRDFLTNFFQSRQLENANGSALFRYKIKEFEFSKLGEILRLQRRYNDIETCACFVLFASEQWRRSYNGGYWNWDLILRPINAISLSPKDRYTITIKGLRYWKRDLFSRENQRCEYLGTIYREAGIPSQVLSDRGVLTNIIIAAYKEMTSVLITERSPIDIIANYADRFILADALKTPVTYSLLNDTVDALRKFKTEYKFDHVVDPVQFLNEHHPKWKDEFPFKVEDVAENFIKGIFSGIREIQSVVTNHVQLQRVLNIDKGNLETVVNCNKGFRSVTQLGISDIDFQDLSKRCKLVLESESGRKELTELYKTSKDGENGFLFSDNLTNYSLGYEAHRIKWELKIKCEQTGVSVALAINGSEKIDEWEPWVFIFRENKWILKTSSGSARISDLEAIIAVMAEATVECSNIVLIGSFGRERKILRIYSDAIINYEGDIYKIKFSQHETSFSFELRKDFSIWQIPFYEKANANIFVGRPIIYKVNSETGIGYRYQSKLKYKRNAADQWTNLENDVSGNLRVALLGEGDEIVYSKRLQILPRDFSISHNDTALKVHINHQFNISIYNQEGLEDLAVNECKIHDTAREFAFSNASTSEFVLLKIYLDSNDLIEIKTPIPSGGVRLFNKNNKQHENNATLYIHDLYGHHFLFSNCSPKACNHSLILQELNTFNSLTRRQISLKAYEFAEKPLMDFKVLFQKLLYGANSLDATVRIDFGNNQRVNIKQYSCNLSADLLTGIISTNKQSFEPEKIEIRALRLDQKIYQQQALEICNYSDEGFSIPSELYEGIWFVYPALKSKEQFRPFVIFAQKHSAEVEEETDIDECYKASLFSKQQRIVALGELFDKVGLQPQNQMWMELDAIYQQTNHLPLSSLDHWKALSKSHIGMAGVFFNMLNAIEVAERIYSELGFFWFSLNITKWLDASTAFYNFFSQLPLNHELSDGLFAEKCEQIDSILQLKSIANIIALEIRNLQSEELAFLISNREMAFSMLKAFFQEEINGDGESLGLRQRVIDSSRWPELDTGIINRILRSLPMNLKELIPDGISGFMNSVIFLPLAIGHNVVEVDFLQKQGFSFESNAIELKKIIEFDEKWFYFALNQAILVTYVQNK